MPQLEVAASYGSALLDWLETYTFAAKLRYADPAVCEAGSARLLDALLAHGTTAAVVFPTVHKAAADALFAAAEQRGMRLIASKCLMDRHAPAGLTDSVASAERDTVEPVERWRGRARLAYAHTARFAPTSSDAQLALAGRLLGREGAQIAHCPISNLFLGSGLADWRGLEAACALGLEPEIGSLDVGRMADLALWH